MAPNVGERVAEALMACGRLVNLFELRPEAIPADTQAELDAIALLNSLDRIEHAAQRILNARAADALSPYSNHARGFRC